MEHVVFFPTADGTSGFQRLPSLEDAVRLVEHLRNVEGVDAVTVHALTEVPLQFKAYYRVEVPSALDVVPAQPVAAEPPVVEAPVVEAEVAAEVAEEAAAEPVLEVAPPVEAAPALALVEDLPAVEDEPVLVAANGHAKDGVASLGFFA